MWLAPLLVFSILTFPLDVSSQPGFLSLDCGGTQSYTDANGISWVPDDGYISTGSIATTDNNSRKYRKLRYFPGPMSKHCYTLPVIANRMYLVRPVFYYGNYDSLNNPPIMEGLVGPNHFFTADLEGTSDLIYFESIFTPPGETLDFCLAASPGQVPFISTLELRLLGSNMYQTSAPGVGLQRTRRVNLASSVDLRYPDDPYDRIWAGVSSDMYTNFSANGSLPGVDSLPDRAPASVLQTGITSNTSIFFSFPVTLPSSLVLYYVAFFFFDPVSSNTRTFSVWSNSSASDSSRFYKDNIVVQNGTSMELHDTVQLFGQTSFEFRNAGSALGPVLNAAELAVLVRTKPGTDPDDLRAIGSLKSYFSLSEWSGDPCLPAKYAWNWTKCDLTGSRPQITVLNLSSMQLNGTIPENITLLTHLREIHMDKNSLTGPLPDFSSLKNLTILDLSNNGLSGNIPDGLLTMPSLQELLLDNNNITNCATQDQSSELTLRLSGNPCSDTIVSKKKNSNRTAIVGVSVGVSTSVVLALLVLLGVVFICKRKAKLEPELPLARHGSGSGSSYLGSFTYQEILEATNNFQRKIGQGGFGSVYYGKLASGQEIAVKRNSNQSHGVKQFENEVNVLSVVHHRYLVPFVGFCNHDSEKILVYEYMSKGTLQECLYGRSKLHLSWKQRMNMALEAAQGLDYLHTGCTPSIIHRDIKSSNILLSDDLVAKLADFGLSKLWPKPDATHASTVVQGTIGYLDPESVALTPKQP